MLTLFIWFPVSGLFPRGVAFSTERPFEHLKYVFIGLSSVKNTKVENFKHDNIQVCFVVNLNTGKHQCLYFISHNSYQWQNGGPLSFQKWRKQTDVQESAKFFLKFRHKTDQSIPFKFDRPMQKKDVDKWNSIEQVRHPDTRPGKHCTAIRITNLAQTEWVSVSCNVKIAKTMFCQMKKKRNITKDSQQPEIKICLHNMVLLDKSCYSFQWQTKNGFTSVKLERERHYKVSVFFKIYDDVSFPFPFLEI